MKGFLDLLTRLKPIILLLYFLFVAACGSQQSEPLPTEDFSLPALETITAGRVKTQMAENAHLSTATWQLKTTNTVTPPVMNKPTPTPATFVGAGDIAICGQDGDDLTSELLDKIPGMIFTTGDNSNESGTMYQYQNCFGPSWGRHLARIYPSPGNHDYNSGSLEAYFSYFYPSSGDPGKNYYSFDLGNWHIVSLNNNCSEISCGPESDQIKWLKQDLEAHSNLCTLAFYHKPRWSSGPTMGDGLSAVIWKTLYAGKVDVVVNGDEHHYERFARMGPDGAPDRISGIRQFIVGTGGAYHGLIDHIAVGSEVRHTGTFGVIRFTLYPSSYSWEFVPVDGESFTDFGQDTCN